MARAAIKARAGIPSAAGERARAAQDFTAEVEGREPAAWFRQDAYVLPKPAASSCR